MQSISVGCEPARLVRFRFHAGHAREVQKRSGRTVVEWARRAAERSNTVE
jgi:hypothetical protein